MVNLKKKKKKKKNRSLLNLTKIQYVPTLGRVCLRPVKQGRKESAWEGKYVGLGFSNTFLQDRGNNKLFHRKTVP